MRSLIWMHLLCLLLCVGGSSCQDLSEKTEIEIVDPTRHYYPIVQGKELSIVYEIKNTGKAPLNINEVLPTCGCIIFDETQKTNVPPKGKIFLELTYNSNKNVGLVNHFIYLYGNFADSTVRELSFDVHVVPDALYTKDYEELKNEEDQRSGGIDESVNGNQRKEYYTK